jgi:hypothetical protein
MKNKEQLLKKYRRFRATSRRLNNELLEKLPKDVLWACGQRLGVLEAGKLYLDESELPLFMDYCLHHGRTEGQNVIAISRDEDRFAPDSEEQSALQIMSQAYPVLFEITDTEVGYGVWAYDVLREQDLFVMDQGFSHSAAEGLIMGANLLPLEEVVVTSGAAFPLHELAVAQVEIEIMKWEDRVGDIEWNALSTERSDRLATILVQAALDSDAMAQMHLLDEEELREVTDNKRNRRRPRKK